MKSIALDLGLCSEVRCLGSLSSVKNLVHEFWDQYSLSHRCPCIHTEGTDTRNTPWIFQRTRLDGKHSTRRWITLQEAVGLQRLLHTDLTLMSTLNWNCHIFADNATSSAPAMRGSQSAKGLLCTGCGVCATVPAQVNWNCAAWSGPQTAHIGLSRCACTASASRSLVIEKRDRP